MEYEAVSNKESFSTRFPFMFSGWPSRVYSELLGQTLLGPGYGKLIDDRLIENRAARFGLIAKWGGWPCCYGDSSLVAGY